MNPKFSVIVTCGIFESQFKEFIESFIKTQPIDKIELILVTRKNYNYKKLINVEFFNIKQIFIKESDNLSSAHYEAINITTSEYIVFLEDHTVIENGSLENIFKINDTNTPKILGWIILPYNENFNISWIAHLIAGTQFSPGSKFGEKNHPLAFPNICYPKSSLLKIKDDLPMLIQSPYLLQEVLMKLNVKPFLTDEFTIRHKYFLKFSKLSSETFWISWTHAAIKQKVYKWNYPKRLLYCTIIMAKPFYRLFSLYKNVSGSYYYNTKLLNKHFVGTLLVLIIGTVGEIFGHIFGIYKSSMYCTHHELDFDRCEEA
ncbi:glycosyltransferase [Bacteroidota bacterium]